MEINRSEISRIFSADCYVKKMGRLSILMLQKILMPTKNPISINRSHYGYQKSRFLIKELSPDLFAKQWFCLVERV